MKKIYIVLSDTGSLFTRSIKLFTRTPYNHSSIAFESDLNTLYSFGRKNPNNPFIGGFVEEHIDSGTFKKFYNTSCLVLSIEVSLESYTQLQVIVDNFVTNKDDYQYNLIGMVSAMVNRPMPSDSKYFCSSFLAESMRKSEMDLIKQSPYITRPGDFMEIENAVIEYEGLLREYTTKEAWERFFLRKEETYECFNTIKRRIKRY